MKRALLILLLLTACTSVSYQEHTDAGSKYVLTNGLTIILKDNPDTGMAAINAFIARTVAADGDLHGLGHLTNRLILAGTPTRSRQDIINEIEGVGGSITARTYTEYSEILIEVPSDQLSTALTIMEDILLNPTFPEEEIERERTIILGEIEANKDDPNIQAEELFLKTLYKNHPYQHPLEGYPETVKKITRADITNHYNTWYKPNNIVISIVGNIKKRETIRALSTMLGDEQPQQTPTTELNLTKRISPETRTKHMDLESFYIQQGYQTIPATHPDFEKLRVTQALLGAGSGSRLFYELRDKRALAYSVYAIAPSVRSTGFLKISMISRPQVLNQSLHGIKEQIDRVKTEDLSENELNTVKQKMRGFFFLDHQTSKDQANYLGFYEMQGLGYYYDVDYPRRLLDVTSADVKYAANKYLNNPATAIVGPFEEARIE